MKDFLPRPSVDWDDEKEELLLLDQTLLPGEEKVLHIKEAEAVFKAICLLQVRGAPAIGVAAAFGLYLAALKFPLCGKRGFMDKLKEAGAYLASSRPTAVNLSWAIKRLINAAEKSSADNADELRAVLLKEAKALREEDILVCQKIGEWGLTLLKPGMGLLTHCNAGQLATIRYGTALAPIYLGQARGYSFKVFADETRPLLQGARLTAYELKAAGVDITLICDNMAAFIMAKGLVQGVLVGCDRVSAKGDCANKIGTLNLAVLAKHFKIPFYVCAPVSTIDFACPGGENIPIEERPGEEISHYWYKKPMAPEGVNIFNPAFDITPPELINAFITEKGIILPPYKSNLAKLSVKPSVKLKED